MDASTATTVTTALTAAATSMAGQITAIVVAIIPIGMGVYALFKSIKFGKRTIDTVTKG